MYRWCLLAVLSTLVAPAFAADDAPAKLDPRYPFRTDFANANLPWYKPVAGEFPPHHSDRCIGGELVSADFYHRRGQFRASKTGELIDFTMPPYGSVNYLNSDGELRDVPLGTFFLFFLNQDEQGGFTRLATMQDQFTMDAGHGFSYRVDEVKPGEGKILVTKQSLAKKQPDLGKRELAVDGDTRLWKGDKHAKLSDLAAGDDLLFNLTGKTATSPGRCTDIWIGAETHRLACESQRTKHAAFMKARGLPGWIDQVEGNKLSVALFSGDATSFKKTYLDDFAVGKDPRVCVANDELRTWNPPVDGEKGKFIEMQNVPVNCYGTSGVRIVVTVPNMLEGFRKGRVVRLFGAGWVCKDPPCGEGLMNYGYGALKTADILELTPKEYAPQFPFRTDYGNETLAWYQLSSGGAPPRYSEHRVMGELLKADAAARSGQLRVERSGEVVDFTLISEELGGSMRYLNADATLAELPVGTRCRFSMYQDEKGAFTRASLVSDEFTYLAGNAITYRVESMRLAEGKLRVALQIPEVKNYNGDMEQPPDIGRLELLVNADTRVWKGTGQAKLADLAVGDALLVNVSAEQAGVPFHCTDIWVGAEAQQLATDQQAKKHPPQKKPAKR